MSEPDPIQKQRQLLQAFRQATTQRTKLEAVASNHFKAEQEAIDNDLVQLHQTADTERAAAEATAQAKRNAGRRAADISLKQIRQGSADRFVEIDAARKMAHDRLVDASLVSLMSQARSQPPVVEDSGDPARELVSGVNLVRGAAASISDHVDQLLRERTRSHQRRQLFGTVLVVVMIIAALAFLGWQARQAEVARSAVLQAGATARAIAAEGTATARSIVAQGTATAEANAVWATATAAVPELDRLSKETGMEMAYVPPGEFVMGGSIGDINTDVLPHRVNLGAYWIDQTEVTVEQYQRCVRAGDCSVPNTLGNCTYSDPGKLGHPVNCVDWDQATTYCAWAGKSLPSEAQWEKAARGADARFYPWGNQAPNAMLSNFGQITGSTTVAGSYPNGASPFDVMDMAGNVSEWVADWYDRDYYAQAPITDPPGPNSGQYRVVRGGAWNQSTEMVTVTNRKFSLPDKRDQSRGFRCVFNS